MGSIILRNQNNNSYSFNISSLIIYSTKTTMQVENKCNFFVNALINIILPIFNFVKRSKFNQFKVFEAALIDKTVK